MIMKKIVYIVAIMLCLVSTGLSKSILDFGAVQNQTNDCSPFVALAIKDLGTKSGSIFIPDGDYYFYAPIKLGVGQSLRGESTGARLHFFDLAAAAALEIRSHSRIENLALIGGSNCGTGMVAWSSTAIFTVSNVEISGFTNGISIINAYVGRFLDCLVDSNIRYGVSFTGTFVNQIQFVGGHYSNNEEGFHIEGYQHTGNLITATIENNRSKGISIVGHALSLKIKDCYFERNGTHDILIDDNRNYPSDLVQIEGNVFYFTPTSIELLKAKRTIVGRNNFGSNEVSIKIAPEVTNTALDHNSGGLNINKSSSTSGIDSPGPAPQIAR